MLTRPRGPAQKEKKKPKAPKAAGEAFLSMFFALPVLLSAWYTRWGWGAVFAVIDMVTFTRLRDLWSSKCLEEVHLLLQLLHQFGDSCLFQIIRRLEVAVSSETAVSPEPESYSIQVPQNEPNNDIEENMSNPSVMATSLEDNGACSGRAPVKVVTRKKPWMDSNTQTSSLLALLASGNADNSLEEWLNSNVSLPTRPDGTILDKLATIVQRCQVKHAQALDVGFHVMINLMELAFACESITIKTKQSLTTIWKNLQTGNNNKPPLGTFQHWVINGIANILRAPDIDNIKVPAICLGSNNYRWTQTERILAKDASKATNLHDLDKKLHQHFIDGRKDPNTPYLEMSPSCTSDNHEELYNNLKDVFKDIFTWIDEMLRHYLPKEYEILSIDTECLPFGDHSVFHPFLSLVLNINVVTTGCCLIYMRENPPETGNRPLVPSQTGYICPEIVPHVGAADSCAPCLSYRWTPPITCSPPSHAILNAGADKEGWRCDPSYLVNHLKHARSLSPTASPNSRAIRRRLQQELQKLRPYIVADDLGDSPSPDNQVDNNANDLGDADDNNNTHNDDANNANAIINGEANNNITAVINTSHSRTVQSRCIKIFKAIGQAPVAAREFCEIVSTLPAGTYVFVILVHGLVHDDGTDILHSEGLRIPHQCLRQLGDNNARR
ncbi:predicted protein [Postia placenta Mad-698-R]|nr:predicted protein [Postia placenta Mad-698-R]